jgi:hypothetical protein
MTTSNKMSRKQPARARRPLRSLDARDLAAVSGGIIIYGSTAIMFWRPADTSLGGADTIGNPEELIAR